MLKVEAKVLVTYTCTLTKEDESKVRKYAKENEISLEEAIQQLWEESEINIYTGETTESECDTQEVGLSEFNDKDDL